MRVNAYERNLVFTYPSAETEVHCTHKSGKLFRHVRHRIKNHPKLEDDTVLSGDVLAFLSLGKDVLLFSACIRVCQS